MLEAKLRGLVDRALYLIDPMALSHLTAGTEWRKDAEQWIRDALPAVFGDRKMKEPAMNDDEKKNVIDLQQAKELRGAEAHEAGEAFALTTYIFADEDIGLIEGFNGAGDGVSVIFDPEGLKGIVMSKTDAEQLGVALIRASGMVPRDPPRRGGR